MPARIETYIQDRPKKWIETHPHEKWRCDIYPDDGSDHHGLNDTEAGAIHQASLAYLRWVSSHSGETK